MVKADEPMVQKYFEVLPAGVTEALIVRADENSTQRTLLSVLRRSVWCICACLALYADRRADNGCQPQLFFLLIVVGLIAGNWYRLCHRVLHFLYRKRTNKHCRGSANGRSNRHHPAIRN